MDNRHATDARMPTLPLMGKVVEWGNLLIYPNAPGMSGSWALADGALWVWLEGFCRRAK